MASIIKSRTISSVVDNRIQMSNSYFCRAFTPPTGWSTLRLAFRYCFTDQGLDAGSTPVFAFGLCSGQTNIFGDVTTDHFVGWKTTSATWVRATDMYQGVGGSGNPILLQPFKKIST